MGFAHLGKCWGKARPAGEGERLGDATRKIRWINSSWWLDEASREPSSRGSACGFQPALQIRRTEEIEEGFCQGFQLLQGQARTLRLRNCLSQVGSVHEPMDQQEHSPSTLAIDCLHGWDHAAQHPQ
jgi:hypothetical protein